MNETQTLEFLKSVADQARSLREAKQLFNFLNTESPQKYQLLVKTAQNLKKATLQKLVGRSEDLQGLTPEAVAAWSVFVGPGVYESDVDTLLNWMTIKLFTDPQTVLDKQEWLSHVLRSQAVPTRKSPQKLQQALEITAMLQQAGFKVPQSEDIKQWSATQLTAYLNKVSKLLKTPQPSVNKLPKLDLKTPSVQTDCHWVEPNQPGVYLSPSRNFSMLALITCVVEGIPMKALFTAWWSWVNTVARPVYEKYADQPIPERVWQVWNAVRSSTEFCYAEGALNYLQSILDYGKCQCSCGVHMLLELIKSLDPSVKLSGIIRPGHMALIIYDENQIPYLFETTSRRKNIIPYQSDDPAFSSWTLLSGVHNSLIHVATWMRIFMTYFAKKTQTSEADYTLHIRSTMCHLHTLYQKMPKVSSKRSSLAFEIFRNFAGYAAAIVDQDVPRAQKRAQVFLNYLNTPGLPTKFVELFKFYFQLLENVAKTYLSLDNRSCDDIQSANVQKQLHTAKRKLFTLQSRR